MRSKQKYAMQIITKKENFSSHIFDNLDVSENTRKDYSARIGTFLFYIHENSFNKQSCLQFKRHLERSNYSVATKNKYLATARIFLKELVKRRMLPPDTTFNVKQFRQSKKHRRSGLTDKDIQLLGVKLKYLPNTPRNNRLRAIFSLLTFQGLRQIEIVRLDVEDIDLNKKTALIQGKGEDDKEIIYLAPATIKALKEYLTLNPVESGSLFRSMGNRGSDRLSTMTIKREIGEILKDLGIQKSVHGFRHFYVTELLKSMDLRDVRKFSRHRSLEMIMVYDDEVSVEHKSKQVFQAMQKFDFA
jgi:integrase/recombinase XerC